MNTKEKVSVRNVPKVNMEIKMVYVHRYIRNQICLDAKAVAKDSMKMKLVAHLFHFVKHVKLVDTAMQSR